MGRDRTQTTSPELEGLEDAVDAIDAIDAMGADELRLLIREMIPWLEGPAKGRLLADVIDRAARGSSWTPELPAASRVAQIEGFAKLARAAGYADPSLVDRYLQDGCNAFLARGYSTALQIYRAWLLPISVCDIDLGQHELVDEVLGIDASRCAAQYVVATYMTVEPVQRAEAVCSAIADVAGVGDFWDPLREMEDAAVEPLPELALFLPLWRTLIERESDERYLGEAHRSQWLREVVQRLDGAVGLGELARASKESDDLGAWCSALFDSGDWKAARLANEESAQLVGETSHRHGDFLDGAALCAQALGSKDVPALLERAWRRAPSMLRLRRWLGLTPSKAALRGRASSALETCPTSAHRQRALLYLLIGDLESVSKLLDAAPGLGWSRAEHPGHVAFPFLCRLLALRRPFAGEAYLFSQAQSRDYDALALAQNIDQPHLNAPTVEALLERSSVDAAIPKKTRAAAISAMRKAAEKRLAGVTENKRRRHYDHAAALAGACVALDRTSETESWIAGVRAEYRRYPALRREFEIFVGTVGTAGTAGTR